LIPELERALEKYKKAGKRGEWFSCIYNIYQEDKSLGGEYNHDFRAFMKANAFDDPKGNMNLLKKSFRLTAQDSFDDYMTYLEWERDPERRFWLPRRKKLLKVESKVEALVNGKLDLLAVSLPPGSGKTTLKTFVLSWVIGKYPDMPNLDSGHSGSMTQSTYDGVLQIIRDPDYLWGDVFPGSQIITNAKELTIDIDKKHRFSSLTCRAIGASLTGATRCEMLLTADDLVSGIEEAMSKDRLDKKWDAYVNDLKSRKKLGAKELHIATRWSVHDVIGRLEREYEDDPRAEFIVIPALDENGESNFDYDYGVGFDTQFFLDMKASMDDVSFRALYMNQPIEREGILYHPDDLQRYYELPEGEPDAILGVCDTAEGGGDDTVLPVFAVYGQKHYLVDVVCSNALPEITDNLCAEILIRTKAQQAQFESNSAGGRTADVVQQKVKDGHGHCNITKKRTTANKETKIIVNSAWVKEHCVFLDESVIPKGSMYSHFIQKLCSYTQMGKNKHDDCPDAVAQYALFYQSLVGNVVEIIDRKRYGF